MHPPCINIEPRPGPKRLRLSRPPFALRIRNRQLASQNQMRRQRGMAVWRIVRVASVGPGEDVREAPRGHKGLGGRARGRERERCWWFGGGHCV